MVKKFLKAFKAGWDEASKKPAPQLQRRRLPVKINRFFVAGKDHAVLWRGVSNKGESKMYMEQWIRNPFTRRMEWAGSYLGEWDDDKAKGEPKEITMMVAEAKFPGSIKAIFAREALRGR